MSNFKRWSPILVSHSVLIQFKENYLLYFQGCGFSIQKKYKSHLPFSRYSKSCGEGKAEQKTCLSEREDMITAKMNYMDKRCYRVPQMPRLGEKSQFTCKGKSPNSYSLLTCGGFSNTAAYPVVLPQLCLLVLG